MNCYYCSNDLVADNSLITEWNWKFFECEACQATYHYCTIIKKVTEYYFVKDNYRYQFDSANSEFELMKLGYVELGEGDPIGLWETVLHLKYIPDNVTPEHPRLHNLLVFT